MLVAVCNGGYVRYRYHSSGMLAPDNGRVVVEELRGETAEIEAGLWRFIFELDLVDRVTAPRRPVDEPLRWRLADPRRLGVDLSEDMLHLKVLDVAAAFTARGYLCPGQLVLRIVPPAPGGRGEMMDDPALGTWRLEAGPDGSGCSLQPAGTPADLELDSCSLGSLYLGGVSASTLAAAGRIRELTAGGVRTADLLLTTRPAPLTTTWF